jgi:DNA-binding transcriptional MerR regulator
LNYEVRGIISAVRDFNGHRRFSLQDALKLREIFEFRRTIKGEWKKNPR